MRTSCGVAAVRSAFRAELQRLENGAFRWPAVQDGVIHLSPAQLSALLEGLDWRRVHVARDVAAPVQPS